MNDPNLKINNLYLRDQINSRVRIRSAENVFLGQIMSGYHFES